MAKLRLRRNSAALQQREFEQIVAEASAGDYAALRRLQQILDERPEIWQSVGDLSQNAELAVLRLAAGKNALLRESLERSLKTLKRDILPPDPSPLEKLLVDRVAFTWLRLQYIETNYVSLGDLSLAEKKFALQQRESAQRLFDAAIRSLRTVHSKLGKLPAPTQIPSPATPQRPKPKLRVVRSAG